MMNNEEVRGAACPLQSLKKHTPYHECTWFREKENFQNSSTRLEYRKPRRESKTICFPNFFAIVKVLPVFQFVIYPSFFLLSNHNLEFSMKKKLSGHSDVFAFYFLLWSVHYLSLSDLTLISINFHFFPTTWVWNAINSHRKSESKSEDKLMKVSNATCQGKQHLLRKNE